ncbi:hypothetical protein GF407_03815 [candidate division KSB1 bacterium]|nr:hypothetical protein [candidate division KSB1 bacterium]
MPIITVEKPLKEKLGDEAVDSLVHLINQTQSDQKAELVELVGEKFEQRLSEEMGKVSLAIAETEQRLDNRITEQVGKVNERLTEQVSNVNERLTEEIGKVNERLTEEIGKVNERLTEEIGKVNGRLTEEIGTVRVEAARNHASLIKWMFIFWVGQVAALLGILFAFFK